MIFIAPKNFKSGRLLTNKYTWFDLCFMIVGIIGSVVQEAIFLIFFLSDNILVNILLFSALSIPAITVFALVQPNGIYHNFLTFFELLIIFIKSPKRYIWGGLIRNVENEED